MGNGEWRERGGQIHASAHDRRGEPTIERAEKPQPRTYWTRAERAIERVVCVATKITTIIIRRV